ncbi:MAG: hypothetical protein ACI4DN_02215 [Lachnospiraceae bacterium]
MKKKALGIIMALVLVIGSSIPALAATVYYKGDAVYWNYGRKLAVISFSEVQTTIYEHSATANATSSGWKNPGVVAYAEQFVGTGTAVAYWNCR